MKKRNNLVLFLTTLCLQLFISSYGVFAEETNNDLVYEGDILTPEMREAYEKDGTLEERLEYYEEHIDQQIAPELVENLEIISPESTSIKADANCIKPIKKQYIMPSTGNVHLMSIIVEFQDEKIPKTILDGLDWI